MFRIVSLSNVMRLPSVHSRLFIGLCRIMKLRSIIYILRTPMLCARCASKLLIIKWLCDGYEKLVSQLLGHGRHKRAGSGLHQGPHHMSGKFICIPHTPWPRTGGSCFVRVVAFTLLPAVILKLPQRNWWTDVKACSPGRGLIISIDLNSSCHRRQASAGQTVSTEMISPHRHRI